MKTRYRLSLILYVPFLLLAMLAAPILPLFATLQKGKVDNGNAVGVGPRLPRWLSWFQTPDNSLFGDPNWEQKHDGGYLSQVGWLWRNPAYGLAWGTLAYLPPAFGVTYRRTDLPNGYRIDGSDGSYEYTRWYWGCMKVRTGWILGDVTPGRPALFLCSIRPKKQPK